MAARDSPAWRRLRQAMEKVKSLLPTNLPQWLRGAPTAFHRLGFEDHPGLLDIISSGSSSEGDRASPSPVAARVVSRTASSLWSEASGSSSGSRAASNASSSSSSSSSSGGGGDVDERAEAFIANFWRHIQMERQVSLQLRYCKSNSSGSRTTSD